VDAPWCIRNGNLHKDLDVATVDSVIKQYAQDLNNAYIGISM
jgi:hypothetical protein